MRKIKVGLYDNNCGHQVTRIFESSPEIKAIPFASCNCPDAEKYEGIRVYDTLDQMIADGDVELISLCSPNRRLQAAEAIKCMQAGKHVYAEKPCAMTERELGEIRSELKDAGYIKKTAQDKKNAKPMPPLEFTSPNGFTVYVGRNNLQNDRLSLKTASKNDWWFHVQKAPGSHVVLSLEGNEAQVADMEFAAAVAAHFSSCATAGLVEVDYTQVRNLKKPPASAPGFVIYHVYKTMRIQPLDPEKT